MRWLYLLKLLRQVGALSQISERPFRLLWRAWRGKDTHELLIGPGRRRLCAISPPNLYGFLLLRQAGLVPAAQQPEAADQLLWQLAPGRTFLTRLRVGMDLMTLYELFGRKDYGENFSGQIVVDVGAYNGDSAVYFALQGAKQVIALEPYPPSFALAEQNVARMGLNAQVTLVPAALGAQSGQATFRVAPAEPDANSLAPPDTPLQKLIAYTEEVTVPVLSLPELRAKFGLEEIDFLKLDCEGCEFALIAALSEAELRKVRVWHIEYHARPEPLIRRLEAAGYQVEKRLDRGILGYLVAQRR